MINDSVKVMRNESSLITFEIEKLEIVLVYTNTTKNVNDLDFPPKLRKTPPAP